MRICVLGAGVAGCATAYQLARDGHEVVLVDAHPRPGQEASFANGGQLSYSYVEPFASPSVLQSLPKLLWEADSPLRLRLRADPAQWRWIAQFLLACSSQRAAAGTRALLALGALSRATLEQWRRDEALPFSYRQNGKLVLCATRSAMAAQERQVALQATLGASQEILSFEQCIAREPALAGASGFVGGVWTESEAVGDARAYCEALVAAAALRGAKLLAGTRVLRIVTQAGRARRVRTSQGDIEADAFVLCAGLGSVGLAATLGERLPIYPLKGYSLTLPIQAAQKAPSVSVTDLRRKMVFARLGSQLRVAAMVEIGHDDATIPPDRITRMTRAVEELFPGACRLDAPQAWAGLRPATPDSLPILRASRIPNVLLNTGHGALGFTLAAGSAARVSTLVDQLRRAGRLFPAARPATLTRLRPPEAERL